jgi:hypothetical protein
MVPVVDCGEKRVGGRREPANGIFHCEKQPHDVVAAVLSDPDLMLQPESAGGCAVDPNAADHERENRQGDERNANQQ